MLFRFASIARATTHGYMVRTPKDGWEHQEIGIERLAPWAWEYATYGDGMIQHEPETLVSRPMLADFCGSFVAFILAEGLRDPETSYVLFHNFNVREPSENAVLFAQSLRHDVTKARWYNLATRTVSAARSKAHDRRWKEVPNWADGSLDAAYGIAIEGSCQGFLQYQFTREKIHEILSARSRDYVGQHPGFKYGTEEDRTFAAYLQAMNMLRFKCLATGSLNSYREMVAFKRQRDIEGAAAIAELESTMVDITEEHGAVL
jgi:hypothetical protein